MAFNNIKFILEELDSKNFVVADFQETLRKARVLATNMEVIEEITGKKDKFNVSYDIVAYGNDYADEFTLVRHGNIVEEFPIEILTDKQAESNEKEEIAGGCIVGVHSTEGYKLGETVQTYKQIGDTKYWYREL